MPRVTFIANLRRHVDASAAEVPGATVGEALAAVFARRPDLRGYIVDDQGALRRHVVVFVGGVAVRDRLGLTDAVAPGAEITVMPRDSGDSWGALSRDLPPVYCVRFASNAFAVGSGGGTAHIVRS